jgi:low temperature requirement protein LtrA
MPANPVTGETRRRFRDWFWRPPRPHGAAILDRRVSYLELFYDLVYVAVIGQAAHHLAEHVSLPALAEFAVLFALIWFAWLNGSLYLELHGREDGRTRTFVFIQMGILAVLAVFTDGAAGEGGPAYALVFGAFLVVMTWLWYTVRRQDRLERPEFLLLTQRYLAAMALSVAVILASAFLPSEPAALRLITWAVFALTWVVFFFLMGHAQVGLNRGLVATDSLVERFGLFTIIVLGEVVFGVVEGLSAADHDALTIATGMIALLLGFGFWWIYFDVVGHRLPRNDAGAIANWMLSHYPITLSIAAGGAAVIGLIEHAHDASTPAVTAWLLGGAVAVGLIALIFTTRALADAQPQAAVYRPLTIALAIGAAAAGAAGWARPAPWLLALALVAILSLLWCFAVDRFLRAGAWGAELPPLGSAPE